MLVTRQFVESTYLYENNTESLGSDENYAGMWYMDLRIFGSLDMITRTKKHIKIRGGFIVVHIQMNLLPHTHDRVLHTLMTWHNYFFYECLFMHQPCTDI